jgi:hypothetical protein
MQPARPTERATTGATALVSNLKSLSAEAGLSFAEIVGA